MKRRWSVAKLNRRWSGAKLKRRWSGAKLKRRWSGAELKRTWSGAELKRNWSGAELKRNWSGAELEQSWSGFDKKNTNIREICKIRLYKWWVTNYHFLYNNVIVVSPFPSPFFFLARKRKRTKHCCTKGDS